VAWALVGLGIAGVSLSAPIATAVAAPALAVAFWRSALGAAVTVPVAVAARSRPGRAGAASSAVAGVLLAAHFGLWIPSLRLTSVAASTALVTTAPLWTVVLQRLRGIPVRPRVLAGVVVALAGALAVTGADAGRSPSALVGDLLALAGGIAGAGYVVVGEGARRTTSTAVYTAIAYSVCAAVLAPTGLLLGQPLAGWGVRTWIELGVLTVSAQLLGHTALNAALPTVGATPLSLAILLEVPGATLVAWAWLGQRPPIAVVPGVVLILSGLWVVVRKDPP
jgi:drug/metabolite transporter (DMT)-like permease